MPSEGTVELGPEEPTGAEKWRLPQCPSVATKRDQDLRDTAVTWLARAGCNELQIAAITGHSLASIHNVLKHYLALHPEMADAAIGKMLAWMESPGERAVAATITWPSHASSRGGEQKSHVRPCDPRRMSHGRSPVLGPFFW